MPYFTLWMLDFFIAIRVSNGLNPDQAQQLSGLIWAQTICKGYQQSTLEKSPLVDNELNTKQIADTTVSPMFTVVALGPVTCSTNGTGSQLTTENIEGIILFASYTSMALAKVLATTNSEAG